MNTMSSKLRSSVFIDFMSIGRAIYLSFSHCRLKRRIASVVTSCLGVSLFTNCSRFEPLAPDALCETSTTSGGTRQISVSETSDFTVVGTDARESDHQTHQDATLDVHEKLYLNGSGDASTAPRWRGKVIDWYYNPAGQPRMFTDTQALEIIHLGLDGRSRSPCSWPL